MNENSSLGSRILGGIVGGVSVILSTGFLAVLLWGK